MLFLLLLLQYCLSLFTLKILLHTLPPHTLFHIWRATPGTGAPTRAPFNRLWVPDHYWTRALIAVPGVSCLGPRVFRFRPQVSRCGTLSLLSRASSLLFQASGLSLRYLESLVSGLKSLVSGLKSLVVLQYKISTYKILAQCARLLGST